MAVGTNEVQVQWSAANSLSISASSNATSDAAALSATAFARAVQLKADNSGTPASGDTVDFYLLGSLGDPDGASTEEYETAGHAQHLCRLDTNVEDPAGRIVQIPATLEDLKIRAVNNSAGRAIVVSATVLEKTA